MSTDQSKNERKIYRHVVRAAYKAGVITLAKRRSFPRALLLPGRERNWLWSIAAKVGHMGKKRGLPNPKMVTRLHPPINAIVHDYLAGIDHQKLKPRQYLQRVKSTLQEWKDEGSPRPGDQIVGNTIISIKGEKGRLFLRWPEEHGPTRFLVGSKSSKKKTTVAET